MSRQVHKFLFKQLKKFMKFEKIKKKKLTKKSQKASPIMIMPLSIHQNLTPRHSVVSLLSLYASQNRLGDCQPIGPHSLAVLKFPLSWAFRWIAEGLVGPSRATVNFHLLLDSWIQFKLDLVGPFVHVFCFFFTKNVL